MALLEPLYKVSEICSSWGIENVIVSPGSRSAALTLAFSRNKKLKTHIIIDERSAAFVALGMAQVTGKPVILICTSGTAALNYAPAVAEAFFQKIPLLVLTADRPPEWINQHDGQTIYQRDLFGKHIVRSYELPVDYNHPDSVWQIERTINEALAFTTKGPVHINIPIREPFYPTEGEIYKQQSRKVNYSWPINALSEDKWEEIINYWKSSRKIVIAIGQNHNDINNELTSLHKNNGATVLADVISNVSVNGMIRSHDLFLPKIYESTEVDLFITTGKSFISKALKQYFRNNKPVAHWHIEDSIELTDPFQSISEKMMVSEEYFFSELAKRVPENESRESKWKVNERSSKDFLSNFIAENPFGELKAIYTLFNHLKMGDILHLGNSMPVRYANILNGFKQFGVEVYANRGTSGIDGIVSTAVGQAVMSKGKVHCLVGDVSFFYDSNALFSLPTHNLNVYVLNNGGGNIFRIIDGPNSQPELESHFITNTGRSAKNLAKEAGYIYYEIRNEEEFQIALNKEEGKATLFEIFLDGIQDAELFKKLKTKFI